MSGGQHIGASASVLPMNIQGWFPLGLTDLICLLSMGLWTLFSSTKIKNISSSALSLFYSPTLTCVHVVVIQLLSHVWLFVTPCTAACQASQSTISRVWSNSCVCDATQPSHPLSSLLFLPLIFPRVEVFLMNWLYTSCGQSIGASASASVLPMNIQGWFSFGLTGLISLQSKGLSGVFSSTTIQKHQLITQPSLWSNYHKHTWLLEKPWKWKWSRSVVSDSMTPCLSWDFPGKSTGVGCHFLSFDYMDLVGKVMSLLFNTLSRFIMAFLPRSKHLNFMAAVTICRDFGAQENKICHCFHFFPFYLPWSDETDVMVIIHFIDKGKWLKELLQLLFSFWNFFFVPALFQILYYNPFLGCTLQPVFF